ncbi:hypothetical protein CVO40_01670 [Salmonella enterica subsp. enterica serovar Enteritidis]|nr:hypothetical protein [Salmonella enterica subsp. enterica serovar Enteritidis]
MAKVSLEKDKIKFLLVEGVHQKALESLRAAGYTNIEYHKGALDAEQLKASIRDAHFIGLRSRTHLTEEVINAAEKLVAIGCFCIGTNQVDLNAAAKRGIPVFNAPFSNTRSVAELVIGELLLLLRGVPEANAKAHRGVWNKLAAGSFEARGTVVDIPALCDALATKHLAGAAIDVFPTEPATNSDPFTSPLCEFDNVILTPHIGGSTQEAQENIGLEVAGKLIKYSDNGSTLSAVNFPEVSLPLHGGRRLMHIHENRPGVLTALNQIFAEQGVNIAAQYLQTSARMGYVVIDIEADGDVAEKALLAMKAIPGTIRARLLY